MRIFLIHWASVGIFCVTALALAGGMAIAETIRIVSPAANTNADGNGSQRPNRVSHRVQQLIPASDFADLPDGDHLLVAFNYRADRSQTTSLDWGFGPERIWISTTQLDRLTNVFDDNHGTDKTLVYDGELTYPLLATGPQAGPRDIADGPLLQRPFRYDPSEGNLLIERLVSAENPSQQATIDIQLTRPGHILINDTDPDSATGSLLTSVAVLQFEFVAVPEPSSLVLAGLGSAWLVMFSARRQLLGSFRNRQE